MDDRPYVALNGQQAAMARLLNWPSGSLLRWQVEVIDEWIAARNGRGEAWFERELRERFGPSVGAAVKPVGSLLASSERAIQDVYRIAHLEAREAESALQPDRAIKARVVMAALQDLWGPQTRQE